ncbi:hypothetical protein LTR17_010483 [Elasticomyces elasticus]|nr:hypothetical protein LTR17_010483 [Elasticomyces elasticus]
MPKAHICLPCNFQNNIHPPPRAHVVYASRRLPRTTQIPQARALSSSRPLQRARESPKGIAQFRMVQSHPQAELSAEGRRLRHEFATTKADPIATFRSRLESGTADLETGRICLEMYYMRLKRLPRLARRQCIRDEEVGTLTLKWLWTDDHRWVDALNSDSVFLEMLHYFAVAEAREAVLVRWLAQPVPPHVASSMSEANQHQWRGAILRHLMRAHTMLDCKGSADDAIELFFRVAASVKKARRENPYSPLAKCSLWPAQVELTRKLSTERFPNTSPRLFDMLVEHMSSHRRQNELASAKMVLAHPTLPNPRPTLSYIQQNLKHMSRSEFDAVFLSMSNKRDTIYYLCHRTETALRAQGALKDADEVKRTIEALLDQCELLRLQAMVQNELVLRAKVRRSWIVPSGTSDEDKS